MAFAAGEMGIVGLEEIIQCRGQIGHVMDQKIAIWILSSKDVQSCEWAVDLELQLIPSLTP